MITKLMKTLRIEVYDYIPAKRTLIIYEPIPVKVLSTLRNSLKGIEIIIKS